MRDSTIVIDDVRYVDADALWGSLKGIALESRGRELMHKAGVSFFDDQKSLIARSAVALIGVGGIPIHIHDGGPVLATKELATPKAIRKATDEMMGIGGMITYLNPKDATPQELAKKMQELNHYSTAHLVSLNILVAGVSTAVENEFNSQRDIIHFARLTEARTKAQSNPPVVVLYPDQKTIFKRVLQSAREELDSAGIAEDKDHLESQNLVYPVAKGTAFIMTASLRNLQKLVSALSDDGKEEEYKRTLAALTDMLAGIWPDLFKGSQEYGYNYPEHFSVE